MNLNITVNEAAPPGPASTPGTFSVRAFYTETDAGHLYGPFSAKEQAEACVLALSSRPGVINAVIE